LDFVGDFFILNCTISFPRRFSLAPLLHQGGQDSALKLIDELADLGEINSLANIQRIATIAECGKFTPAQLSRVQLIQSLRDFNPHDCPHWWRYYGFK